MRMAIWRGLISCGALATCLHAAETSVSNQELGFEIKFPDGWTVTEKTPEGSAVKGVSQVKQGAQTVAIVKVQVSNASATLTPKALGETLNTELQKRLTNYELVEKAETKIGDAIAYRVNYSYDGNNSKDRVQGVVYFVVANKRAYQITTTANHLDYAKYSADIETIIASFKTK